jgi:mannan endo-1,6-alpha-mannosidase
MGPQTEGNDDQAWWALAAMAAAEYGLASPSGSPSWLAIAQKVFGEFVSRWDSARCNGGMKWQISPNSNGYHYKNSITNGLFFQLAARLARFTGNVDYLHWATNSFDWMRSTGLIDNSYNVFDGTDDTKGLNGCVDVNHDQWSYNVAALLYGTAVLQDYTGDTKWAAHTTALVRSAGTFFEANVMYEPRCEKVGTCNADQLSFKAYLSRWLSGTAALVPSTRQVIMPWLAASATGAAAGCSGGADRVQCGSRWYTGKFDGFTGVGQQLAALEVINGLLATSADKPRKMGVKGFVT